MIGVELGLGLELGPDLVQILSWRLGFAVGLELVLELGRGPGCWLALGAGTVVRSSSMSGVGARATASVETWIGLEMRLMPWLGWRSGRG